MRTTSSIILALLASVVAAKDSRTFAVLRFNGDGFMMEGRVDPIVSPKLAASHLHGVMGGSNFGLTVEGDQLLDSSCSNAMIKNDRSNYWAPEVYFQDPKNGSFTKVPLFYMNVYYFFEATDDEIKAFPAGLKMLTGDATVRNPPAFGGGSNLNPRKGPIQPVQFTCPRKSYTPASYPAGSDGTMAGMQDPNNLGAGAGFPLYPCDGYASPLRADIHFPSCYNPNAGLDDFKSNMAWPTSSGSKQNCPSGYIHVPHLFFELYWNTPLFDHLWTPDGKSQPFVLSNGDRTGYSLHGDFIAGWDQKTLQTIIDTCDAGDAGMDRCPNIPGGLNDAKNCKIVSPIQENVAITDVLKALPGNNPISGWGVGSIENNSPIDSTVSNADATAGTPAKSAAATNATSASVADTKPVALSSTQEETDEKSPPAAIGISPGEDGAIYSTVWDIVTVTETTTMQPEETAHAKRHALSHGHKARHIRSGNPRG